MKGSVGLYVNNSCLVFPTCFRQVTFHFAFPKNRAPAYSVARNKSSSSRRRSNASRSRHSNKGPIRSCEYQDRRDVLEKLLSQRTREYLDWKSRLEYPQNFMRNVAKRGCQTRFTMIPGNGSNSQINEPQAFFHCALD